MSSGTRLLSALAGERAHFRHQISTVGLGCALAGHAGTKGNASDTSLGEINRMFEEIVDAVVLPLSGLIRQAHVADWHLPPDYRLVGAVCHGLGPD